jgi:hypothetical protein
MSTPAADIIDVLAAAGVGVRDAASGWGLYLPPTPVEPDTAITVYDSGGRDPHPALAVDNPNVMVRVRGVGYSEAYAKAQAVKDTLLGLPAQIVNGTRYCGVWMRGEINFIGPDDLGRDEFTLNFLITSEPADGGHRRPF